MTVVTADMNDFDTAGHFDRVVSIEMFEHMQNYEELLASDALMHLHAPIQRVTGYDCPMPYFALEQQYMPSVERIVAAAQKTLEYG